MKKICTLLLAAGLTLAVSAPASAIDFKAKGEWLMGFMAGEMQLIKSTNKGNGNKKFNSDDVFTARQRVRLQLDARASENLSGTVYFEIGNTDWGKASHGAALGADGKTVEVKRAYLDWVVPNTDLSFRMGIQGWELPNVAGGSGVSYADVAGVTANYKVNDNASVTLMWARPVNDNYSAGGNTYHPKDQNSYLDNVDLFQLIVPLTFDGIKATPWVMYGIQGRNAVPSSQSGGWSITKDGDLHQTLRPYPGIKGSGDFYTNTSKAYGSMFWAGLPVKISAFDPLNIEIDLNYGWVEAMGRFDAVRKHDGWTGRASTARQGWLAKALVEYKMDWGTPGILGWYASGDDGNVKNGSERMPSIAPDNCFTSFLGDINYSYIGGQRGLDYAGTWGIGLQIRDMSFVEDLKHTFRAVYYGGTNSPKMAKYMEDSTSWNEGWYNYTIPYLTTNDGLLELNLVNDYKIYDNLKMSFQLGYVANFMDNGTWKKTNGNTTFNKQDAWKASVVFAYSF